MKFDWFGFGVFAMGIAGLQLLLEGGETQHWFGSSEIIIESVIAVLGFYLFTVHILSSRKSFITPTVFKDRNLLAALLVMFAVGMVLLSVSVGARLLIGIRDRQPVLEPIPDDPMDCGRFAVFSPHLKRNRNIPVGGACEKSPVDDCMLRTVQDQENVNVVNVHRRMKCACNTKRTRKCCTDVGYGLRDRQ